MLPFAALAVMDDVDKPVDAPLAYLPRAPDGRSFREMIERGVGWSRR
jgi:hypothetical protein